MINFLANNIDVGNRTAASCYGLSAVVFYGVYIVKVIQIVVPILLIN